jgi:hypothetical protein
VRNEQRLGMNANLRRVCEHARGQYLKVLCADAPRCLERMVEAHPDAMLATSATIASGENGRSLQVQFLFGESLSVVPGQKMLDRMARGHGFGGNSGFLIRASAYDAVGGFDDSLLYAADYDLAARLCQMGNYVHTDEPLFYGRLHGQSSSSVDPGNLLDVRDWFSIPDKVLRPRPFGSRNWLRYQVLTGLLTARYSLNFFLEWGRGHREYAHALRRVLREQGNFIAGTPLLALHVPARIARRLTGRHRPRSRPPESWMGPPTGCRASVAVDCGTS